MLNEQLAGSQSRRSPSLFSHASYYDVTKGPSPMLLPVISDANATKDAANMDVVLKTSTGELIP